MKWARQNFLATWLVLIFVTLDARGADNPPPAPGDAPPPPERSIVERGAHHRVWQRDEIVQLADGRTTNRPVRVIEYQTGLHFVDPNTGDWAESRAELEIVGDGAQAVRGWMKLHVAGQINSYGAITITTPPDETGATRTMRAHCLGLVYADPASGQQVWVMQIQNSTGLLFPPNLKSSRSARE